MFKLAAAGLDIGAVPGSQVRAVHTHAAASALNSLRALRHNQGNARMDGRRMLPSSGSMVAAWPSREYMLQADNRANNHNGGTFIAYYFGTYTQPMFTVHVTRFPRVCT